MRQIISELISTIEKLQPASLLYCTPERIPALDALATQERQVAHVRGEQELEALPRMELGVVFDCLEQLGVKQGTQLLGKLRNLKCEKLWVAVNTASNWHFTTMIGLGFTQVNCYVSGDEEFCTYSYDIATYNHKRSWNNSRFWANPENWGKYRW